MRLPKTVQICGKTYNVTKNAEKENGRGRTFAQQIEVGTKDQTAERCFSTFVHEVAELVCCENNYRYGDGRSETSVFVMSHKEFERFIDDVAIAIRPMVR